MLIPLLELSRVAFTFIGAELTYISEVVKVGPEAFLEVAALQMRLGRLVVSDTVLAQVLNLIIAGRLVDLCSIAWQSIPDIIRWLWHRCSIYLRQLVSLMVLRTRDVEV